MRRSFLALLLSLMMLPVMPTLDNADESKESVSSIETTQPHSSFAEPFIHPPLQWWYSFGDVEVEVIVLTEDLSLLHDWQSMNGLLANQAGGVGTLVRTNPESLQGDVHHRNIVLPASMIGKMASLSGIRAITEPLPDADPYDIEVSGNAVEPNTVKAKEIHGSSEAWSYNITGDGVKVAIVDSGVDFAHPDLNGTQSRVDDSGSPWNGWPIAHDPRSLNDWLVDGETYPDEQHSWFSDTSTVDNDSDNDSILDTSGYDVSGVISQSGDYRTGEHPDGNLQSRVGGDVAVLLVDSTTAHVYDTVYVDLDGDDSFSDEIPMSKGNETAGLDLDDDGLWDRSAGMIYFIADGNTSLQYAPTLAARKGYADRIPSNGDMVAFMLNEGSGPAGNHGTLCASAVAAQAVVSNGKVQGMAPNASIISVGNYYNGGSPYDAWRFVAEGPDGIIDSGDEAQIGSFSFGYSSTIDAGSDFSSLYLDWLTRVHSRNTTYMVALGNGGHGYGTVASPGGAAGIMSVGAASSKTGQPIGDTWGDMAMWTNRGPNSQGRMDPDIVAIGWSATGDTTLNEKTNANSATATWGGTSLATPLAAGLMALVFEAYHDEYGIYPDSQVIRDIVMSTARDLAQDPLVQGGGWFDAARAVRTIQSQNDTWWAEPAALMPGENDGAHRIANSNWMIPGQTIVHNLTFHNPTNSVQNLNLSTETWQATSHDEYSWLSNSSMGWDGHQASRPDLVIPVLIHNDSNNTRIANDSTLVRARSTLHPLAFDGDQNRQYENRVFLYMYRWNDTDGDGMYWNDSNNDSFVQDGEWSASEVSLMTSFTYTGPQAEVKISDPWEEDCDGILLAVSRSETRTGHIDPTPVSIDITGFSPVVDNWLSTNPSMWIPPTSSRNISVSVSVPLDAVPGLKQSGIRVDDGRGRDWLLPVVTTVAGDGPTSWIPPTIDGNVSNQSLYRETWIQGAQRWGWRAESGDWKAFAVDWPSNMTDGTIIIDVDWPDNGHTDIDAFWLSEISHPFSTDDPDAYGSHGMHIETGSSIENAGGGVWRRQTSTGGDRELLSAEATPGHKILLLHSTMHGVLTNDNPINVTIGYANALQGNLSTTVVNWSLGDFNDSAIIASTADVEIEDVSGYGWTEPMYWANESISQDTPGTLSTSSYIRNISLLDIEYLRVQIDTNNPGDDLDLYLYRDKNGNGQIDWSSEKMESSGNGDSNELCEADTPADGLWWIVVHGYDVPANNSTFWLSVKMIGGSNLVVDDHVELNSTEIQSRWPSGAAGLGGIVPERAWQVNFSITSPQAAGIWNGYISLQMEGGGAIEVSYEYRLMEIPANVLFSMPLNGSFHNGPEPISARIWDIGGGFNLSGIELETSHSLNLSNHSLNVSGFDSAGNLMNLSSQFLNLTNDVVLSEVWLNFTLPEDDLDHHFILNVSDYSGFFSSSELFVTHDSVEPWFQPQGLGDPTTLSNQTFWNLSILGEPYLEIEVAGVMAQTSIAEYSLYSELNLSWPTDELHWYNLSVDLPDEGANLIFINASDRAQNLGQSSIVIIRDTIAPVLEMRSDLQHLIVNTSSLMFEYKVEPGAEVWVSGNSFNNPENMAWNQYSIVTEEGEFTITMTARDDAGNWADAEMTFTVDSIYPILQWLEPEVNASLSHRVVPLAWALSENASMELRLDTGDWSTLPRGQQGRNSWVFELSELGEHRFCLRATDDGRNSVVKCLDVSLPIEVYTPDLFAPWEGTWVNVSNVTAELYLGPGQTWDLTGQGVDEHGTGLGGIVNITIPLTSGENNFVLQAQGMGVQSMWNLTIFRDSVFPTLNITSPPARIAFVAAEIPSGHPMVSVEGITDPEINVRCDVPETGTWSQTISDSNGAFQLGVSPWSDWRQIDLDSLLLELICTATDSAGNSVSQNVITIIDTSPPEVMLEWNGDIEELYLTHDIVSEDEITEWSFVITHDGRLIESYTELEMHSQLRMQGTLEGVWNATLTVVDSAGHRTNVSVEVKLVEPEQGLFSVLEAAGGPLNVGIGALVLIAILIVIFRRREDEEIISVPMDPELFVDEPVMAMDVEPQTIRQSAPSMLPTPDQTAAASTAATELFSEQEEGFESMLEELEF